MSGMRNGEILTLPPAERPVQVLATWGLSEPSRRALYVVLRSGLHCVWHADFSKNGEHNVRPDWEGLAGPAMWERETEQRMFYWLNYCRWRALQLLRDPPSPLNRSWAREAAQWASETIDLRNALTSAHDPLAIRVARSVAGRVLWIDFDDLLQLARFGLIHACDYFDVSKRVKFSTFGTRIVWQKLVNFLRVEQRAVTYSDAVPDLAAPPDQSAEDEDERAALHLLMRRTLTRRERQVLSLTFGTELAAQTLRGTGLIIGLSGERVRQIRDRALAKIRAEIR